MALDRPLIWDLGSAVPPSRRTDTEDMVDSRHSVTPRRLHCIRLRTPQDAKLAREVQELLAGPSMRVNTTPDVIGVEICGALKNVLAIAAGIVEGLDLGNNAMAALLTQVAPAPLPSFCHRDSGCYWPPWNPSMIRTDQRPEQRWRPSPATRATGGDSHSGP